MNTFIEIISSKENNKGNFDSFIRLSRTGFSGLLHQVAQREKLSKAPHLNGGARYMLLTLEKFKNYRLSTRELL